MQILMPGQVVTMPQPPPAAAAEQAPGTTAGAATPVGAAATGGSTDKARAVGRPPGLWPEELTPVLVTWLQGHPSIRSLDKAVQVRL